MQENETFDNQNQEKFNNTKQETNNKPKNSWQRELITFALLIVFVVLPLRLFIAKPFLVSGASMYPTFETGDYLIVDQISYRLESPSRGDVVIFRFPQDTTKFFIKRIIALPNERLIINGEDVYIEQKDGTKIKLEEKFVELEIDSQEDILLADDEYFVMGDNRLQSLDSRAWGPLKQDYIVGRAYLRLLPFNKIDFFPGKENY